MNAMYFLKMEPTTSHPLISGRMCNGGQTPEGLYTTTAQDGTIRLFKKNYLGDQIELIFTAFHLSK